MRRGALTVLVLLLVLAAGWWFGQSAPPLPPPARVPEEPIAAPPVVAEAPALPAKPAPVDAGSRAPLPTPPQFSAGFCAEGGEESFTIRRTLPNLLQGELARRLNQLPPADRARIFKAAGALERKGVVPDDETPLLVMARQARPPAHLLAAARELAGKLPGSPWPQIALALLAESDDDPAARLLALRRARQLLPDEPALGWAIAQATRDTADVDDAIAGLTTYLAAEKSAPIARLRARLLIQRDIQRDFRRQSRGGLTLLWPADALTGAQADGIATAVLRALDDAARLTDTRRRKQLTAIVYPSRSELLAVSCAQAWTGGLYDGTLRLVAEPEQREGVDPTALRHESLHAQLSPSGSRAPRWFQEGLAQSFAGEAGRVRGQWRLMVKNRSWIPFSSLDGTFQIFEANSDASLAYAQSLGLVELMREAGGDAAIGEAVRAFQDGATTTEALARACRHEVTGSDLLAFLERRLGR